MALGSYRNSPFVTGHYSAINGLKTEILNYALGEWELTLDYPFSNNNRYLSKNMGSKQNLHDHSVYQIFP